MAYPGARIVLFCCFFVHFGLNADSSIAQIGTPLQIALVYLVQGITLLFYPVVGLVADLKCNRYNFVKLSTSLLFVCNLVLVLFVIYILVLSEVNVALIDPVPHYAWPILAILFGFIIISLGMFDAVGVQFGMDQMIEASSDQISAFTHWYYWSMNIALEFKH